jgi:hypothetical protein
MSTRTRSTTVTVSLPIELAEAIERARGDVPRSLFVRRALESVLNTSASSGGGPSSEVIPGESGRGAGKAEKGRRRPDAGSRSLTEPASAPSRASSDGGAGGGAGRTDGVSHVPASPARKRSKVPAGPQASPPDDVSSSASQGREGEAGVNGGAGAAQTTVEEMLASCPNCASDFFTDPDGRQRCTDCSYVREP